MSRRVGERTVRPGRTRKAAGNRRVCRRHAGSGHVAWRGAALEVSARFGQEDRRAAARALPGVEVVLTAKDVPGERLLGHVVHDWPVMIAEGEETRYVGDALAVLAATTKEAAQKALS
jgi:xanthine dehydrogenase molybdopterin-binding subunit B